MLISFFSDNNFTYPGLIYQSYLSGFHTMFVQGLLYLTCMAGLVASQSIDPNSIPLATRGKDISALKRSCVQIADRTDTDQWCNQQQTSCPLICTQLPNGTSTPKSNTCDPVCSPRSRRLTHLSNF